MTKKAISNQFNRGPRACRSSLPHSRKVRSTNFGFSGTTSRESSGKEGSSSSRCNWLSSSSRFSGKVSRRRSTIFSPCSRAWIKARSKGRGSGPLIQNQRELVAYPVSSVYSDSVGVQKLVPTSEPISIIFLLLISPNNGYFVSSRVVIQYLPIYLP